MNAEEAKQLAHERLLAEFQPEVILFIGHPDYDPIYGIWKGQHKFALGKDGVFTGQIYFVTPDPTNQNVAGVVTDNTDMPSTLENGKIYVCKGEDDLVYLRSFDLPKGDAKQLMAFRNKVAKELGMNSKAGEVAEPMPFSRSWREWQERNKK